jgi:hypothetical protein
MGLAAAAVHTLDPHELCCTVAAHAQTADKELFDRIGQNVEMIHKKVVQKA